ncbi:MAG: hypothetical protein Q8O76_05690 [Chloroflexota bacterium]|nr:hypothetical protein [Chloroflexota bacterium]
MGDTETKEVLSELVCHIDMASGDVVCPVDDEELAAILKLPKQPGRVVFEVKSRVERPVATVPVRVRPGPVKVIEAKS